MKIEMKLSEVPMFTKFEWKFNNYVKIPNLKCEQQVMVGSYKTKYVKCKYNAYELPAKSNWDGTYEEIDESETVTITYNSIEELRKILNAEV